MDGTTISRSFRHHRRALSVLGLVFIPLTASLLASAACGSDQPAHDANGHEEGTSLGEEGTDLVVIKSRDREKALQEGLSEQILSVEHVVHVEKYIRLKMEAFDVVGLEPGGPMRIMTGQPDVHLTEAELTAGRELRAGGAYGNSVLAGELFAHSVGARTGHSFHMAGTDYELAVVGVFSTVPAPLSSTILMPLSLVQEIYVKDGMVTHFWVSVDSPDNTHDVIRNLQLALGESVEVLPRTYQ